MLYHSEQIPDDIREDALNIVVSDLKNLGLLTFVLQALNEIKNQLPEDLQKKFNNLDQIPPECINITIQKGSTRGNHLHSDEIFEAVCALSIPALAEDSKEMNTPAEQQSTLYQTKDGELEHVPPGQFLFMLPQAYPLLHKAPTLSESVPTDPSQARYIITIGIINRVLLDTCKKELTKFGIPFKNLTSNDAAQNNKQEIITKNN